MTIPNGRTLASEVSLVELWEKEGKIVGVILYSPLADAKATYASAKKLLDDWGLPHVPARNGVNPISGPSPVSLDAWYSRTSSLDPIRDVNTMVPWDGSGAKSKGGTYIHVEIKDSLGAPANRWAVVWTADWQDGDAEPRRGL